MSSRWVGAAGGAGFAAAWSTVASITGREGSAWAGLVGGAVFALVWVLVNTAYASRNDDEKRYEAGG